MAKASYFQIKFFEQLVQSYFQMVLFHLIIVSVLFFERIHNLKHLYHGLELLYLLYDKVYAFSLNTHHTSCAKLWFSGVSREEIMRNGWTHRLFSAQIKMDNEKNLHTMDGLDILSIGASANATY